MLNRMLPTFLTPVSTVELEQTVGGGDIILRSGIANVVSVDHSLTYALNQPIVIPCPLSIG